MREPFSAAQRFWIASFLSIIEIMKKGKTGRKILIGVGILIMLLGVAFMYLSNRNRTLSPPGNAELTTGSLIISLTYSRPSVRERVIFGTEAAGALQPYGQYWRLGANEATEITFSEDVLFNGESLEKGTYKVYAIPNQDSFDIIVNTSLGDWGAFEPDHSMDILTTKIPVVKSASVEQHTITLKEVVTGSALIVVEFSDVRLEIPVSKK